MLSLFTAIRDTSLFTLTVNDKRTLICFLFAKKKQSFWAPNAVTWGYDSRAASIRVIAPPSCAPSAARLEVRVPGADMNPYFALSAIFLLGLRGIRRQIPLTVPPVAVMRMRAAEAKEGRGTTGTGAEAMKLARSLEEATALFGREGSVAREVFGDEFVEHYKGTREHEVKLWNEAVTNWEGMYVQSLAHSLRG